MKACIIHKVGSVWQLWNLTRTKSIISRQDLAIRMLPINEYIAFGRKPWQYRPAGSAIVKDDSLMLYPRVCAHRGFNAIAPENSMPAFGAAIALDAEEIAFDLWPTQDGEIVSCHDDILDRVSDGRRFLMTI